MKSTSLKLLITFAVFNLFAYPLEVKANTVVGSDSSNFTLISGNQVYLNSGGDFDGDSNNPNDDALIYAHNGFTMNSLPNTIFGVQKDSSGNILMNGGLKVLVDNAVAVGISNPAINAPNNPYYGLTPPSQVAVQTINIPAYETLKTEEKNKRNMGTNSVTLAG
jgi:hypothetical protein